MILLSGDNDDFLLTSDVGVTQFGRIAAVLRSGYFLILLNGLVVAYHLEAECAENAVCLGAVKLGVLDLLSH